MQLATMGAPFVLRGLALLIVDSVSPPRTKRYEDCPHFRRAVAPAQFVARTSDLGLGAPKRPVVSSSARRSPIRVLTARAVPGGSSTMVRPSVRSRTAVLGPRA